MSSPPQTLLDALDATPLGEDRFEARSFEHLRPRVFGGELIAQALATAARTVEGRACHAIHVDFLSPGDPKVPIEYRVRRLRDGRRFVQRQVSGHQRGREIVLATVSFTTDSADAAGFQHQPMPDVPGPEGLISELEQRLAVADRFAPEHRPWLTMPRAVEVRQVRPVPLFDPPPVPPIAHAWIRAVSQMPDDPALHCAVLAYASDATLLDIACYPHGVSWISPQAQQASLSHAMCSTGPSASTSGCSTRSTWHRAPAAARSRTAACSRATARLSPRWCRKACRRSRPPIPPSGGNSSCRSASTPSR